MDYKRIYNSLVSVGVQGGWTKRSTQSLIERHHIVPKSAGGTDEASNLVYLTPREHFIAHKLLWKAWPTQANLFAYVALARMSRTGVKRCTGREVEKARTLAAQLASERMSERNPAKGRFGKESYKHIGMWVTPAGRFASVKEAAEANSIGKSSIQRRCRNPDTVISADRLGLQNRDKTWRELGYWFEEAA